MNVQPILIGDELDHHFHSLPDNTWKSGQHVWRRVNSTCAILGNVDQDFDCESQTVLPWPEIIRSLLAWSSPRGYVIRGNLGTIPASQACTASFEKAIERSWVESFGRRTTETAAQLLLSDIRTISGFTLEEIAPLVGVSRRSLQNWLAGGAISGRKERRLRTLVELLRALPETTAEQMRRQLLDRTKGGLRPYDLLVGGRYQAAYLLLTGKNVELSSVGEEADITPMTPSNFIARLGILNDGPASVEGEVDFKRSGRLKR